MNHQHVNLLMSTISNQFTYDILFNNIIEHTYIRKWNITKIFNKLNSHRKSCVLQEAL